MINHIVSSLSIFILLEDGAFRSNVTLIMVLAHAV
jgi:hypothetical protein